MIKLSHLITADVAGTSSFRTRIIEDRKFNIEFEKSISLKIFEQKAFVFGDYPYELFIIEDEWKNIGPILNAFNTEEFEEISNVLILTNAEMTKDALRKNKVPPQIITLDFNLGKAKNFYDDTFEIHSLIKEHCYNTPVIAITSFEQEDEAKKLVESLRKNGDSVYSKDRHLWEVLPNIIRDKLSINRLKVKLKKETQKNQPKVFIGSSSEALELASSIANKLSKVATCTVWDECEGLGETIIDILIEECKNTDYAIFIFHPDDVSTIRGRTKETVRDNVIFETGLFMSKLGYKNVFIVTPTEHDELRILTDIAGIKYGEYKKDYKKNIKDAVREFCTEIEQRIQNDQEKEEKVDK